MYLRYVLFVLLAGSTVFASQQTYREWRVHQAERLASHLVITSEEVDGADEGLDPASMPARMAVRLALVQARVAARMPKSPARTARIVRAGALVDRAISELPNWGEAWVAASYVSMLSEGPSAPGTHAAFARSLETAPYLIEFGLWRLRYGVAQWNHLDTGSQRRVMDEARWLSSIAPTYQRAVLKVLNHS